MSDDPKPEATPSAPKKRAPRAKPPTKAAALKALGLSKEDLDNLKAAAKELAELKAQTPAQNPQPNVVEASATLRPAEGFGGDGTQAAPSDPQQHLESRPAPSNEQGSMPTTSKEPVWYIRNLRGMEVGFRLSRQNAVGQKRTNLKPRGMRGDIVKLEPGDLQDAELQTQVSYGLVEVIPEGEALEAIKKQYTNHANAVSPHIAMLRNPLGQEYNTQPRTLSDEESMGYKVADLDPRLMQGKLSDQEIRRGGGFAQDASQTPTGGNPAIISDGFQQQQNFMAPTQTALGGAADNEKAAQIDALARSTQFEGPGAGLGEVTVKVEPVQRVQ